MVHVVIPALSLLVALSAVLLSLPWETELQYSFERDTTPLDVGRDLDTSNYRRRTIFLGPQGHKLECWLYTPVREERTPPPPVLIMAHGLGAQKDMALHPIAEHFVTSGMATVVFDYRHFGGSDGEPRHILDWRKQLEDWEYVVMSVRNGSLGADQVDSSRVALWGASYSGAHVLMTAAKIGTQLTAVVANEPYLDGRNAMSTATTERGVGRILRLALIGVHCYLRGLAGMSPAYITLIAEKGSLALLEVTKEELSVLARNPPKRLGGWKGVAAARFILANLLYHPIDHVHNIRVPTLLVGGVADVICPIERIRHAAELIGDSAVLLEKPYGHLELHKKQMDPVELAPIVQFLQQHLNIISMPDSPLE